MTNSAAETAQTPEKTPDEMFAEHFSLQIGAGGYYVEYGGQTKDDVMTYYALVMKEEEYEQLLEEQNQRAAANHADYHKYTVGPKPAFQPSDTLNWETMVSQPTFSGGHTTREEALMTAGKPLLFKD